MKRSEVRSSSTGTGARFAAPTLRISPKSLVASGNDRADDQPEQIKQVNSRRERRAIQRSAPPRSVCVLGDPAPTRPAASVWFRQPRRVRTRRRPRQ